jgi:hypothetical protein
MIFDKAKALISLRPTASFVMRNNDIEWKDATQSCPTESELNAEIIRLQAEYDAKQYQRNRAAEYPSFAEQFDTLYHGGYDAWKAQIDAIKLKYPKV